MMDRLMSCMIRGATSRIDKGWAIELKAILVRADWYAVRLPGRHSASSV